MATSKVRFFFGTLAKYEEYNYSINNILQYNNLLLIYQKYN